MLSYRRWPLWLLVMIGIAGCRMKSAIWVLDESTADHLVFGISTAPKGTVPVEWGVLTIYRCQTPADRVEQALWTIEPEPGSWPPGENWPTRVVYGKAPDGFRSIRGPHQLSEGCYEALIGGRGVVQFEVRSDGTVQQRTERTSDVAPKTRVGAASETIDAPTLAATALHAVAGVEVSVDSVSWILLPRRDRLTSQDFVDSLRESPKPLRCHVLRVAESIHVDCANQWQESTLAIHKAFVADMRGEFENLRAEAGEDDPLVDVKAFGETFRIHLSTVQRFVEDFRIDSLALGIQTRAAAKGKQTIVLART